MNDEINDLKKEADELGITYSAQIGAAKLKEKIDAYYESQETSEKELIEAVKAKEANEQPEEKSPEIGKAPAKAGKKTHVDRRREAEKTKVVTIIDNDQRVNNVTSTCTVNCSNMYFDLGTIILPLNMAVEVKQGHLNVLKELKIPQHVKDTKTGLSTVRMVPRYTLAIG
jgi:hypothetical protein